MRKAIAIFVTITLLLLCGCKAKEVVVEKPVVVEHTTTQHHVDIVRDTLKQKDSVITFIKGDTLIIEKWHNLQAITNTFVADTVRDTVPQVVTVTTTAIKEVAKPLSWWQKTLQGVSGLALLSLGLFVAFKYWVKK